MRPGWGRRTRLAPCGWSVAGRRGRAAGPSARSTRCRWNTSTAGCTGAPAPPGSCSWGGGAGWSSDRLAGKAPVLASATWPRLARVVDRSMRSGSRGPEQRENAWRPTGIEVRAWLPWKQLPPAGRGGQGQVGPARPLDHVADHPVARGGPEVLVQVGRDQDAVVDVVDHPVALDPRVVAAAEHDAVAEGAPLQPHPGRVPVVVAPDVVADDVDLAEGRQQLDVERVRDEPGASCSATPIRRPRARRRSWCPSSRARSAPRARVDHRAARLAPADVEAGVGRPVGVAVLDDAVGRIVREDAVVAVVERVEIRAAIAFARRSRSPR